MEFGIFIQNFVPQQLREGNPNAEAEVIQNDIEIIKAADKAGFKYMWASEHHFLDEYSHLSANDALLGYLAGVTERIHLGSGIYNPLPQVNHPAKVAERVAYLDHISNGRFEFGTGRGAGSHEILGFLPGIKDMNQTKEIWEDVIREFPKMWLEDEYQGYEGKYWSLPPRKILPKPLGPGHPAMWYACGSTSSYEMAARYGLGVLGFSVADYDGLGAVIDSYKKTISKAEPIGAFVNDNVMVTTAAFVDEDGQRARQNVVDSTLSYLQTNVFRYHDTFPRPEGVPAWPARLPEYDLDGVELARQAGTVIGDPDEALAICQRWEDAGADQLVFGVGSDTLENTLEMVRLMGEHVIPKLDKDPEHRTTRMRREGSA